WLGCFVSSRRRHPRFSRDWSSDVCSSDLGLMQRSAAMMAAAAGKAVPGGQNVSVCDVRMAIAELQKRGLVVWWQQLETLWVIERSEERRVGKEGRWPGGAQAVRP